MSVNKKTVFLVLIALFTISVNAQNTTSPYSRYGYGVLKDKAIGASRGMGGISYGLRGQNTNPGNPASYSAVDSLTFIFDMGISYSKARLSDPTGSQSDDNGGLDYVTMLFPIAKGLGFSAGVLPYSSVGYSFGTAVDQNGVYNEQIYSGSGNLSQVYGGIAFKVPSTGLSLGANISYLFGTLNHDKTINFAQGSSANRSLENRKLSVRSAMFDFGLQYEILFRKNRALTLGVVFTPEIKPSTKFSKTTSDFYSSGIPIAGSGDTISSKNVDGGLPLTLGGGFTFSNRRNFLIGADATFQKWKGLGYSEDLNDGLTTTERFKNRYKLNVGVEYAVDPMDRSFWRKIKLRGGFNFSNSYMNVKNNEGLVGGYREYGATMGFGIPLARDVYTQRVSYLNLNFEYTTLRPKVSSMVKEEYFGVSLNVNINDLWFMKNKFK